MYELLPEKIQTICYIKHDIIIMKFFALTVDFVFKSVFGKNEDLLLGLLNSFPQFQENRRIVWLKVLNPEIPKEISSEKFSILDIRAQNEKGESILIEMQAFPQSSFSKRALYYWAKIYSRSLGRSQNYNRLKKVYSISFLNFILWKDQPEYIHDFEILEKTRNFSLTEDLEISIVELPKFIKDINSLKSELDVWIYLLKEAGNIKEEFMKTLEKKNEKVKKAISELKTLSLSDKNRELYEARRKAELDYFSGMTEAFEKGIEKGKTEGIEEGLYLGIQLNLESRFNSKGNALLKKIRKLKDLNLLKKILVLSAKAESIQEIRYFLNKI